MKKIIRLTESDLHKIVKESVNKILKEANWSNAYDDDFMGPNARLEDSYPDEYPEKDEEDPLTIAHNWKEDHLGKI
jgi:hypothetical protein